MTKTATKKPAKRAPKATKQTHVAIVLDESGSMSSMREAAIGLFNTQADAIKASGKKGGQTFASLIKFGGSPLVEEVFHHKGADDLPVLTNQNYIPRNSTPMRDGIGLAITRLEAEDDGGKDTAFLVVVVTDGQENASREWDSKRLREKVAELQKTGRWTFAVYGANITLADLADSGFVVPDANFGQYVADAQGLNLAGAAMMSSTVSYMSMRSAGETSSRSFATAVADPRLKAKIKR